MVVVDLPCASEARIWQDLTGWPSTSTVHAPHCPSPQPYLVPVRSSLSRRTVSRVSDGAASTSRAAPLTRSLSFAMRRRLFYRRGMPASLPALWRQHRPRRNPSPRTPRALPATSLLRDENELACRTRLHDLF